MFLYIGRRNGQYHYKQKYRKSTGISQIIWLVETSFVDVLHQRLCLKLRAALCRNVHLVKYLKRTDGIGNETESQCRF